MTPVLDRKRFAAILARLGSAFPDERQNAVSLADRMLRKADIGWVDIGIIIVEHGDAITKANEAEQIALELQTEVLRLQAQIETLQADRRREPVGAMWEDIGGPPGVSVSFGPASVPPPLDFRAGARWALDLYREGPLGWLTEREIGFLTSCLDWRGPRLTPKMNARFRDLMHKIEQRSGRMPPL
jgi:hypothetical protein